MLYKKSPGVLGPKTKMTIDTFSLAIIRCIYIYFIDISTSSTQFQCCKKYHIMLSVTYMSYQRYGMEYWGRPKSCPFSHIAFVSFGTFDNFNAIKCCSTQMCFVEKKLKKMSGDLWKYRPTSF